jgi:hypothetical protein
VYPLAALAFTFFGFAAGGLLVMQTVRWGALLWVTTTAHGGDFLGPPRRRLLWAFPFVLLLHPVPYFVGFLVIFTIWALQGKVESTWLWLLGGFYVYPAFAGLMMFRIYRLRRRQRPSAGPNNRWRGP